MNFIDFARTHGVDINPTRLYPSDKIKRCPTLAKPRSDNGAYYWDGRRGWVMDWSGGAFYILPGNAKRLSRSCRDSVHGLDGSFGGSARKNLLKIHVTAEGYHRS